MAEAAMFSLASRLLATIVSPTFKMAYEKGRSIWQARDELNKLTRTIQTVQAVLLDAEKKQRHSAAIKDWIERVRDVLYDADDLFDEVTTDDILRQQVKGNSLWKTVRVSCSKFNPIASSNSIANKVKAIRRTLLEISSDMTQFEFAKCQHEEPISSVRKGQDQGSFVDSKDVFGRDTDKKAILEMLLPNQSNNIEQSVSVIAIVGIGGMGKTTLAQLIYNDEEAQQNFEKRWFACISDTSDDKEVLGKIFQSVCEESYGGFNLSQLQTKIRESVKGKKFLLVLDDVWDDDHGRWINRMGLFGGSAKGSKIIVTSRSLSVARGVGALKTHHLGGLSEDKSWDLFKRVAFTPEQEQDLRWTNLGREIVKKCANVPLAIRSVGTLLHTKTTIPEWESFKNEELSQLDLSQSSIMDTLRLSYEHLPPNLKHCFAYCSVFPKDYTFEKDKLIYLWIAQGYIKPSHERQTVEQAGHSYFMDLFRRSFFQEAEENRYGEIWTCKMHDLLHDLAQCVAGKEAVWLRTPSDQLNKSARHVSVGFEMDDSWEIPPSIHRLHSLIFVGYSGFQQFTKLKYLRALSLSRLGIENVPSSIGELKHLRYLDLSWNEFETLPDSLTKLLNLVTLDIKRCGQLKALPESFRKLGNLRHLNIDCCVRLKHMPPGMGELTCLQHLSDFKVGKAIEGVKSSGLEALAVMELRGELRIDFDVDVDNCDGDECWKLPVSAEQLVIWGYPGVRIPHWGNGRANDIVHLRLKDCLRVKHLPTLRCLPNLKSLLLEGLRDLEYVEEQIASVAVAGGSFFPLLEVLRLRELPKLKGWSRRKVEATSSTGGGGIADQEEHSSSTFPLLSELMIEGCPELKYIPLTPRVWKLQLRQVNDEAMMQQLLSPSSSLEDITISRCNGLTSFPRQGFPSLQSLYIDGCHSLGFLQLLASPHLNKITIDDCDELMSLEAEALASLGSLHIKSCKRLRFMRIAQLNLLQGFIIWGCHEVGDLWELEQKRPSVDWDSLPNLSLLYVDRPPSAEELPSCLRDRQALGLFKLVDIGGMFRMMSDDHRSRAQVRMRKSPPLISREKVW